MSSFHHLGVFFYIYLFFLGSLMPSWIVVNLAFLSLNVSSAWKWGGMTGIILGFIFWMSMKLRGYNGIHFKMCIIASIYELYFLCQGFGALGWWAFITRGI